MIDQEHWILYLVGDAYHPLGKIAADQCRAFMHNGRMGDAIDLKTLFNDQEVTVMRNHIVTLEQTRPDIREAEQDYQQKLQNEGPGFE